MNTTIVASRSEALAKMEAAGRKHLGDIYSPAEITAWASKQVDAYLKRGVLVIGKATA